MTETFPQARSVAREYRAVVSLWSEAWIFLAIGCCRIEGTAWPLVVESGPRRECPRSLFLVCSQVRNRIVCLTVRACKTCQMAVYRLPIWELHRELRIATGRGLRAGGGNSEPLGR